MAIKRAETKRRRIDLGGPEGNVFALMGLARTWSKQLGYDTEAILEEMQSSDYRNAVCTMDEHFGSFCDFILPEGIDDVMDL